MSPEREASPAFPQWLLITGFFAGLILAFGMVLGVFVSLSQIIAPFLKPLDGQSENVLFANLVRMKMCMLVGGITAGIALMFLGLPFFLVGFNNTMVVESEKYAVKLLGATPGVLAILGGAVLIGFCCTQQFRIDEGGASAAAAEGPQGSTAAGGGGGSKRPAWFFSGEESGMLEQLQQDMLAPNASKNEFARTAGYLQALYAAMAESLKGPNLTKQQQDARDEYLRLSKAFAEMKGALGSGKRVNDVADQFIKKEGEKYKIQVPKNR
jgi:hypothetical protein